MPKRQSSPSIYVALLRGVNVGGKNMISMKLASRPVYQDMTVRNANTTRKLLELMRAMRT